MKERRPARKPRRTSLEAKLCLLTMGLLFALLLGLGHFSMREQRNALATQKTKAFRATAQALAAHTESLLEVDPKGLSRRLSKYLAAAGTELEYVAVSDAGGKPLFVESRRFADTGERSIGNTACRTVRHLAGFGGLSPGRLHIERSPIKLPNGDRGTLTAAFSFDRLNDVVDDLESKVLLLFAVAFIVGIVLTVVLARTIVGPLRSIIQGARRVAAGDLSLDLDVKSDDEVGELALTFNTMVHAVQETRDQLVAQAETDSLTALYNHRSFQERLDAEVNRAERFGHDLSLLMFDIDRFKDFNDAHGHPAGDAALKEIARIIPANIREIDFAARYGGEEFAVILLETHCDEAAEAAERIRLAVQRHSFYGTDGEPASLTVSIGVAQFPTHSSKREGLVRAADMALYRAKSTGRNTVRVFEHDARRCADGNPFRLQLQLHADDLNAIESLAASVDARQNLPKGHSIELARLAVAAARALGLDEQHQAGARAAALLRDVAQLALPDGVLTKREPLTPSERAAIVSHPAVGHSAVQKAPHIRAMLPGLLHHHERFDGSGFPFGLAGEDISIVGRIVAVADAYMMLRATQSTVSASQARTEISEAAGTAFDPAVVDAFLKALASGESGELAA